MPDALSRLPELVEAVVFGNGWLAAGALALVCAVTVGVRCSRGPSV